MNPTVNGRVVVVVEMIVSTKIKRNNYTHFKPTILYVLMLLCVTKNRYFRLHLLLEYKNNFIYSVIIYLTIIDHQGANGKTFANCFFYRMKNDYMSFV